MSRRRAVFYGVLAVLVGCVLLWFLTHRDGGDRTVGLNVARWTGMADGARKGMTRQQELRDKLAKASTPEERNAIIRGNPLLRKMAAFAAASVHDIELHGLVIDQHGAPVVDASVRYYAGGGFVGGGSGRGLIYTDQQGRFVIDGAHGGSLEVVGIIKSGFALPQRGQDFVFLPGKSNPTGPVWRTYSAENPYTWHMYKLPDGYDASDTRGVISGWARAAHHYVYDRRLYGVDFFKRGYQVVEGDAALPFHLRGSVEDVTGGKVLVVTLAGAQGGGLQPVGDLLGVEAPVEGYAPTITLRTNPPVEDAKVQRSVAVGEYYFRSPGAPTMYGRVRFELELHRYGKDATILSKSLVMIASANLRGFRYIPPERDRADPTAQ